MILGHIFAQKTNNFDKRLKYGMQILKSKSILRTYILSVEPKTVQEEFVELHSPSCWQLVKEYNYQKEVLCGELFKDLKKNAKLLRQ